MNYYTKLIGLFFSETLSYPCTLPSSESIHYFIGYMYIYMRVSYKIMNIYIYTHKRIYTFHSFYIHTHTHKHICTLHLVFMNKNISKTLTVFYN